MIVSNNFSVTEILFDPKIQEVFNFISKLPNYDFDLKSIPFKIYLYDDFFFMNPIKFTSRMNVSNEACCAY